MNASQDVVAGEALSFAGIEPTRSVVSSCIDFLKIRMVVFSKRWCSV